MQKWKLKLKEEMAESKPISDLSNKELELLIHRKTILSSNYDTVLALDFPHYCSKATLGCGGEKGWCYTFGGHQAGPSHAKKVALVDVASKRIPKILVNKILREIEAATHKKRLPYPNLRISGSGEAAFHHLDLIGMINAAGVKTWGFTKNISIAIAMRKLGTNILISADKTTPKDLIHQAKKDDFRFAYTSTDHIDYPPENTLVTFPLHRGGRVREAVDSPSLCPKVIEEFLSGKRRDAYCQLRCNRCHHG